MAVCAGCGNENNDTAKFCSECGSPLAAVPSREQRKVVTVLFCDVTGSTALGERVDPEALREIMARYFETARVAIERHGGTVEKFIGDAVMAVFGVPVVHEDDALRAVRAAVELREAVEVDVHIGISSGEVVTGGPEKLATGDAVNVAARLEQAAATGEILLGAETYGLVQGAVDAELVPPLDAKGKSQPLTAYRLRTVVGGERRRNLAPMVARARELELLERAFERARDEQACHLFTVLGSAGIGKSRLVSEFLGPLRGARVVTARCLSYGDGITYWPVVEILEQLGVDVDSVLRNGTSPPEIAWSVRKALERAALDEPLVLVFDDIQWGEPPFLDLVEHIADLSRGAPILLLCMARPELLDVRPGWAGGKLNATSVLLEPLPRGAVEELLRVLTGAVDERIREAADGNPLFVEEMVELAKTSGGDVAVPPTIQALLAARLDGLPSEERAVLECAAIEGQVFHRAALAELVNGLQLDGPLVALVRKDLIRPEPDDAYRFRHLLIRDAAYDGLPKAVRIALHESFATWLERNGSELVELDELAGYHLEQAALYARELGRDPYALGKRAAIHLSQAAIRAAAWGDVGAAVKLGLRAEQLVAPEDPRRLQLLPLLARALDDCGRTEEALPRLDEAVEHGDAVTSARARAIRAMARSHGEGRAVSWALGEARRALAEIESSDDDVLADVYLALAWLTFWSGQMSELAETAARARAHAERAGNRSVEVDAIGLQASALFRGDGTLERIEEFVREMASLESFGARLRANTLFFRSRCAAERMAVDEARALRASAIGLMDELGLTVMAAGTHQLGAMYEAIVPDWEEAERNARSAWNRLGAIGERGIRSTSGAVLACACAALGRDAEAEALVAAAESMAEEDYVTQLWAELARSRLAANRGDDLGAAEHARRAVAATDRTGEVFQRLLALLALAEAQVAAGDAGGAAATAGVAAALAERRGSPAFLARARAVVATMAS